MVEVQLHSTGDATGGDVQDDALLVVNGGLDLEAVQDEERLHCRMHNPLVAVEEW